MAQRLKSQFLVQGIIRAATVAGAFATVRHRGDPDGGIVYVAIADDMAWSLYVETTDRAESMAWRCRAENVDEPGLAQVLAKERAMDRDLWVIDIEGGATMADLPGDILPIR